MANFNEFQPSSMNKRTKFKFGISKPALTRS